MECVFHIGTEFAEVDNHTQSVFDADAFEAEWIPIVPPKAELCSESQARALVGRKGKDEGVLDRHSDEIWLSPLGETQRCSTGKVRSCCSLERQPYSGGQEEALHYRLRPLADDRDLVKKIINRTVGTHLLFPSCLGESCNLGLYDWCLKAASALGSVSTDRLRRIRKSILRLRRLRRAHINKIRKLQDLTQQTLLQFLSHVSPSAASNESSDASAFSHHALQTAGPAYLAFYYIICLEFIRGAAEHVAVSKILPLFARKSVLKPGCVCGGTPCCCQCVKAFALLKVARLLAPALLIKTVELWDPTLAQKYQHFSHMVDATSCVVRRSVTKGMTGRSNSEFVVGTGDCSDTGTGDGSFFCSEMLNTVASSIGDKFMQDINYLLHLAQAEGAIASVLLLEVKENVKDALDEARLNLHRPSVLDQSCPQREGSCSPTVAPSNTSASEGVLGNRETICLDVPVEEVHTKRYCSEKSHPTHTNKGCKCLTIFPLNDIKTQQLVRFGIAYHHGLVLRAPHSRNSSDGG